LFPDLAAAEIEVPHQQPQSCGKTTMRSLASVALTFLIFSQAAITQAQLPGTAVPNVIAYSGRLHLASTAGSGANSFGVTFSIYRQQDGGAPIWLETQNVNVDNEGRFRVLLGRTRAEGIPASLFSAQEERTNSVGRQIKEGKQGVKMTRLSCHRFRSNQVRLVLNLLA
jgi:hypothetical protein